MTPILDPYLTALQTGDTLSKIAACDALIQAGEGAAPLLHTLLQCADSEVRWRVTIALGWIASHHSRCVLTALLNKQDEAWAVRHSAVWALGRIHNTIAVRKLSSVLTAAATEEQIRYVAAMGLAAAQNQHAEEFLRLAAAQNDEKITRPTQAALINPHF